LQPKPYRKADTNPIIEELFPGKIVTSIVIEPMHTIAGGTDRRILEKVLHKKWGNSGVMHPTGRELVDAQLARSRKSWIKEPARYLRFFVFLSHISKCNGVY
jgi:hypothetical protein